MLTPTHTTKSTQSASSPFCLCKHLVVLLASCSCLPLWKVIALHNVVPFTSLHSYPNSLIIIKLWVIPFPPWHADAKIVFGLGGESAGCLLRKWATATVSPQHLCGQHKRAGHMWCRWWLLFLSSFSNDLKSIQIYVGFDPYITKAYVQCIMYNIEDGCGIYQWPS